MNDKKMVIRHSNNVFVGLSEKEVEEYPEYGLRGELKRVYAELAARDATIQRLREALTEIMSRHLNSCPESDSGDLYIIAARALEEVTG